MLSGNLFLSRYGLLLMGSLGSRTAVALRHGGIQVGTAITTLVRKADPRRYQWIAGTTDISGATGSSYAPSVADLGKTIRVRVSASWTTASNFLETLTSEATATVVTPLTAEFRDAPDKHLGTGVFTFEIAYREPISISYVTLRDDSLDVTNGSATKAKRVNGRSDLWEITVEPDSDADVTVVLPITEGCGSDGAVCTRDGTKLSNRSELTVPGPAAANSPATGAPIISGTAQVGETLTVDTSGIDDADGMSGAVFSYQWLANDAETTGATGDTYTLVDADVGKAVKVREIFNDDDYNEETLTSEATAAVAAETAVPDAPQSLNVSPDDTGTLNVSWEAPASDGGSDITGYKVQWKSGSEDYDGSAGSTRQAEITDPASRTHTITGLTDGVEYTVRVIAVNDVGDGPPSDEATGTPRETTPPELATATVDGTTLTLTYDEALDENSEPSSDAFSVTVGGTGRAVDGVSVSGSSVILTLGSAVASGATVTVSYTVPTDAAAPRIQDEAGNPAASFSDQDVENNTSPPANTPATGAPTISGTAQVGETLTAETSAIADADGMSGAVFIYQWLADDADIAGATSDTYTLVDADLEKAVKVRVIFTDNRSHQETLTSAATAAVEPRPNSPATGAPTISGTAQVGETLTAETSAIADADGMSGAVSAARPRRNDRRAVAGHLHRRGHPHEALTRQVDRRTATPSSRWACPGGTAPTGGRPATTGPWNARPASPAPSSPASVGWRPNAAGRSCSPRRWGSTQGCGAGWRLPRNRTSILCECPWRRRSPSTRRPWELTANETALGTSARDTVGCERVGLSGRCRKKVRSERRAVLVHDEMGGDQTLRGRVYRQGETLQGVGSQQRGGLVFSKDHDGHFAVAIDRGPGSPVLHIHPPTVSQQEPAIPHRLDPELTQQAGGQRGVGGPGVHRRLDVSDLLAVHAGNPQRPLECPHRETSTSQFLPPHFTRFGRPLTGARPLTATARFVHDKGKTLCYIEGQKNMPKKRRTVTFSLPPEMDDQLRQAVREDGRTLSELLREAFRLYLEEREWRRQERMQMRRSRQTEQE